MSISVDNGGRLLPALYESLLLHDRPSAWWGLDTASPLDDDSQHAYTLTALGAPANAGSLLTRGDASAGGARDFNGTTDGYFVSGTATAAPDGPPPFQSAVVSSAAASAVAVLVSEFCSAGDLEIAVLVHSSNVATIASAPGGWTQVGATLNATTVAVAVYKRVVAANEPPAEYDWTWNASGVLASALLRYTGADPGVAGLIFDSGQQVTASDTVHFTTTQSFPDGSRSVVIHAGELLNLTITPDAVGTNRVDLSSSNVRLKVTDFVNTTAGSNRKIATTSAATVLGAVMLTFGSPRKVVSADLDTIGANITLHAIIQPDTIVGVDTIIRKHNSWGLQLNAGVVEFYYRDGAGVDRTITGPTVTAGATTKLEVVDDGTNIRFTKDGVRTTAARVGTAGYTKNANRVNLGHAFDGAATSNFFDGRIDEPAVWGGALKDQMIDAYWRAYKDGLFGDYMQADKTGRYPRAKLEIAWSSKPTDEVLAWDDVSGDVRADGGISTSGGGRNFELDKIESGRIDFALNNRKRKYDSTYTGSPFYPNIKPTKPVRWRAQSAVDKPVWGMFFGYTEGHPLLRIAGGRDSIAQFTASDVYKALSSAKVSAIDPRPNERAGVRISHVMDGIPGVPYRGETGVHDIIADDLQGVNRLEQVQSVTETDGGVLFADQIGFVRFQDNQHRAKYERTVRATYGDGGGSEYPIVDMAPLTDEARLFTEATVTPASGNVKTSVNANAALDHFTRTKALSTMHASDNDAQAMAEAYGQRYSTPRQRIPSMELAPAGAPLPSAMWETVLAHEISHRVKTVERPVLEGVWPVPAITREHFIEGINYKANGEQMTVSISLSPADLDGDYWILGTGKLGDVDGPTSTRLSW